MSSSVRTCLSKTPALGERVFIDPTAIVLGDVVIGDDSSVWPMAVIRGDIHSIRIGQRTNVQDGVVLHVTHAGSFNPDGWPLTIGDDVTIGHHACLHGCTIHDQVLIGMGAMVMDGAVVESEVLVAAGAMVTPGKVLESGFVYKGNPARKARPLTGKDRSFFKYSAGHYQKLKDLHIAEGY